MSEENENKPVQAQQRKKMGRAEKFVVDMLRKHKSFLNFTIYMKAMHRKSVVAKKERQKLASQEHHTSPFQESKDGDSAEPRK